MCGENLASPGLSFQVPGSSPRVRGKLTTIPAKAIQIGLIPACAGKTFGCCLLDRDRRAHPRVCGENERAYRASCRQSGSSPRVRGKLFDCDGGFPVERLIPACAGKTNCSLPLPRTHRAHPRVCGENSPLDKDERSRPGSSPRVRGKLPPMGCE